MDFATEDKLSNLFSKVADGDQRAFADIFNKYYDVIFSTALQYCKVKQLAEDVVQQVFIALWNKRALLKDVKNGEGWIWTLARNQAITILKRESRQERYATYIKEFFQSESETPLQQLLQREKQQWIEEIINSLPERQQQVYRLSRHQGATYAQISETLGISTETVKEHMAKALKKIREMLSARKNELFLLAAFLFS